MEPASECRSHCRNELRLITIQCLICRTIHTFYISYAFVCSVFRDRCWCRVNRRLITVGPVCAMEHNEHTLFKTFSCALYVLVSWSPAYSIIHAQQSRACPLSSSAQRTNSSLVAHTLLYVLYTVFPTYKTISNVGQWFTFVQPIWVT